MTEPIPNEEIQNDFGYLKTLEDFSAFAKQENLSSGEVYKQSLDRVLPILEGKSGIQQARTGIPKLVIGDLHGRRDYVSNLLNRKIKIGDKYLPVFEHLQAGELDLIFLGDGIHTEQPADWTPLSVKNSQGIYRLRELEETLSTILTNRAFRDGKTTEAKISAMHDEKYPQEMWSTYWQELQNSTDPDIQRLISERDTLSETNQRIIEHDQVRDSIGAMKMIMDLKSQFPGWVHFIRGNHDDIDGSLGKTIGKGGVNQTDLFKEWVIKSLGEEFFNKYARFEESLPLLIKTGTTVFSHSAPAEKLDPKDIKSRNLRAIDSLTWTDNRQYVEDHIPENEIRDNITATLKGLEVSKTGLWFIGHRQVDGENLFRTQVDGRLFQICDSRRQLVTFIPQYPLEGNYDPEKHTIDLLRV